MVKYKIFNLIEMFETNTYLIWDPVSLEALLLDPAAPSEKVKEEIIEMNLKLKYIINTHGHSDHIGGNEYFHQEFGCPIGIHDFDSQMLLNATLNLSTFLDSPFESPAASLFFGDFHKFSLGENEVVVYHTPGHTKGCVVVYIKPYLFSGDTLFKLDVGRTDLPGGNTQQITESIREKIFSLPDDTIVLPGHGPSTTIEIEKKQNPYVK